MSIFNMLSDMFFANDKKGNAVQEENKPDINLIVINEALQRIVPRIEREVPETGDFIPVVEKFRNLDSKLNVSEVRIEVERTRELSLYLFLKVDSASGMSTASTLKRITSKENLLSELKNKNEIDIFAGSIADNIRKNSEQFDDNDFA